MTRTNQKIRATHFDSEERSSRFFQSDFDTWSPQISFVRKTFFIGRFMLRASIILGVAHLIRR